MKKGLALLLVVPFLCGCSGRTISSDEAYQIMSNFETNLDLITTFSYYERRAITETDYTRSTSFYQIFFEKNFIHSYSVNEDEDVNENNTVEENWVFIRDGMIYEVTTKNAEESKKGKIYNAYTYDKDIWEARLKSAFEDVKNTNLMYIYRLKNQLKSDDEYTSVTSKSKNDTSLVEKVDTVNKNNKVVRTKSYTFENSLIQRIEEKDDYTKKLIEFKYQITTQEANYPDF